MALQTYNGVVYPAQTDAMGHMTVQYYVAAFDQAMWYFVSKLGYDPEWRNSKQEGWADVRYEIDFRSEIQVGDLYTVESTIVATGKSSLTMRHKLLKQNGNISAEICMKSVYFDLKNRKSIPLPESLRAAASKYIDS